MKKNLKPGNPLTLFAITFLVFIQYSFLVILFILVFSALAGLLTSDMQIFFNIVDGDFTGSSILKFAANLAAIIASLLFLQFWFKKYNFQPTFKNLTWQNIFTVIKYFALNILILSLTALLFAQFIDNPTNDNVEIQKEILNSYGLVMTILFVAGVVPIFEEILFRGFFFAGLRRHWRFIPAALVSTAFFASLHLQFQEVSWVDNLATFISIFSLSFFMTLAFERTGNLWTPILFHSLHNLMVVIIWS